MQFAFLQFDAKQESLHVSFVYMLEGKKLGVAWDWIKKVQSESVLRQAADAATDDIIQNDHTAQHPAIEDGYCKEKKKKLHEPKKIEYTYKSNH